MSNINEVLLNPVRMRIIQELSVMESATTNVLCERISDVPRTTLYRHIRILMEHSILTVLSEEKVRGSVERTLALNLPEIMKHNTVENAAENAFGFLMRIYAKFHRYFSKADPDPGKDRIFLNNLVLMMSDGEFDQFAVELRELLLKYRQQEGGENRKPRDLSIVCAPVDEE